MLLTRAPDDWTYQVAFSDGRLTLEEQLPLILAALRRVPEVAEARREAKRRVEEERLAEQRRREQAHQQAMARQAELKRREDETKACREALHQQARRWEDSERLRAYLAWLDQDLAEDDLSRSEDFRVWRAWVAQELADAAPQQRATLGQLVRRVHDMKRWQLLPETTQEKRLEAEVEPEVS